MATRLTKTKVLAAFLSEVDIFSLRLQNLAIAILRCEQPRNCSIH
jgi:hypothetical protein